MKLTETQKIQFVQAMGRIVSGILDDSLDPESASKRLLAGAQWLEGIASDEAPRKPKKASSALLAPSMAEVRKVFEYWREVSKRPRAKLTESRILVIRARLQRFSVDQLKHVTLWAVQDPFYSGVNERNERFDWPRNIFRSDGRVEKLLEKAEWSDNCQSVVSIANISEIKQLDEDAEVARKEGDFEEFNRIQERIKGKKPYKSEVVSP